MFWFVVDQSQSVGEAGQAAIHDYLLEAKKAAGTQKTARLTFGAQPGDVETDLTKELPSLAVPADSSPGATSPSTPLGTDIASAIEAAAAYLPPGLRA